MARNVRQRLFVHHFLGAALGNGSEAARLAGYGKDAAGEAHRLLQMPEVREAIAARLDEAGMTAEEVLAALTQIADADFTRVADCYTADEEGHRVLDWAKVRENGVGPLLAGVTPTRWGDAVKLHSRTTALELLGRFRSLFADRLRIEQEIDYSKLSDDELGEIAAGRIPRSLVSRN